MPKSYFVASAKNSFGAALLALSAACAKHPSRAPADGAMAPGSVMTAAVAAAASGGGGGAGGAGSSTKPPHAMIPRASTPTRPTGPSPHGAPPAAGAAQPAAGSGTPQAAEAAPPAAGAGAATAMEQGKLTERAGIYTFAFGRRSLVIDAMRGARITRFGLDDRNLLSGPDIDPLNYGATFWPSPQERWGWPPVPELDSDPYTALPQGDGLRFESSPGQRAKVSVKKLVRAMAAEDAVEITYSLVNNDSAPVAWAPWEVTRVAASGLSFFPTGQRKVSEQLPVIEQDGITWYAHNPAKVSGDGQKYTADGAEGWLAHVAGRSLFVKQFMDVPVQAQAPAPEAEIALYAAHGYVELEPQGPYTELMPGQALTWSVRWLVADIAPDVMITPGSPALVQLARALAARANSSPGSAP